MSDNTPTEPPVDAALETIGYGYALLRWRVGELSTALRLVQARCDLPDDVRRQVEAALTVAGDQPDDDDHDDEALFEYAERLAAVEGNATP